MNFSLLPSLEVRLCSGNNQYSSDKTALISGLLHALAMCSYVPPHNMGTPIASLKIHSTFGKAVSGKAGCSQEDCCNEDRTSQDGQTAKRRADTAILLLR